jgi:hypothetical protein
MALDHEDLEHITTAVSNGSMSSMSVTQAVRLRLDELARLSGGTGCSHNLRESSRYWWTWSPSLAPATYSGPKH